MLNQKKKKIKQENSHKIDICGAWCVVFVEQYFVGHLEKC
jgi:hypothetical protein